MSESWQDWDSAEYMEFLERFYGMQLTLAQKVAKDTLEVDFVATTLAVFDKIAPPAVYLKAEYVKWRKAKGGKPTTTKETPFVEPPTQDKWKPTKTKGTYRCSERDATDEELAKAKDVKDRSMWYSPPGEGYRWGLVFKKVKP